MRTLKKIDILVFVKYKTGNDFGGYDHDKRSALLFLFLGLFFWCHDLPRWPAVREKTRRNQRAVGRSKIPTAFFHKAVGSRAAAFLFGKNGGQRGGTTG